MIGIMMHEYARPHPVEGGAEAQRSQTATRATCAEQLTRELQTQGPDFDPRHEAQSTILGSRGALRVAIAWRERPKEVHSDPTERVPLEGAARI